jgi:ferredoxin
MDVSKRLVLHFPPQMSKQAIVCHLARDFDLTFSIVKAQITPGEEGLMVMELMGEQRDYDRGVQYLLEVGVKIQSLNQDVVRNEERCIHCGACMALCPAEAFSVEPGTRKILFDNDKCVVCEICVKACPTRAMELYF